MDVKWFQVVIGLIVGATLHSVVVDGSALNSFEVEGVTGPSIKDISLNGSEYLGEEVTVSGEVFGGAPGRSKITKEIEDGAGYGIGVKCGKFLESFEADRTYSITGTVKKDEFRNRLLGKTETYYYVKCTEAPK